MPQGHAVPCREVHQAADVVLLTIVFTPEQQSPLLCQALKHLKGKGWDLNMPCSTVPVQYRGHMH